MFLPFYRVCHSSQHCYSEGNPCFGEKECLATLVLEIAFSFGEKQLYLVCRHCPVEQRMKLCVAEFFLFQFWDLVGSFSMPALEVDLLASLSPSMAAGQHYVHLFWPWTIAKMTFSLYLLKCLQSCHVSTRSSCRARAKGFERRLLNDR